MTAPSFPDFIERGLKIVAENQKITNPTFEFIDGSAQGFIGSMAKCCISNETKKLSVIIKSLPDNDEKNKKYNSYILFDREVFVYQELIPELEKLQIENGLKFRDSEGFWSYPQCYYSIYNKEDPVKSFLILEDLSQDNFEAKCQFTPSDFEHTQKTFTTLAKLHAASFALKIKKPEIFSKFKQLTDVFSIVMTTDTMNVLVTRNIHLASELFDRPGEHEVRDKVLSFKNDMWQQIGETMNGETSEPYGVMCHGDCWISNAMFNYENGKIKDARLVDWQMTRFGSAASEIMYYFFTCTLKPLRDQFMEQLVQDYYETLENLLRKLNLDAEKVFPLKALQDQMKKFGKFSFGMATWVGPLMSKYPEKLFQDKNAELSEEEQKAVEKYKDMMRGHILDMIAMGAL